MDQEPIDLAVAGVISAAENVYTDNAVGGFRQDVGTVGQQAADQFPGRVSVVI